MVRGLFDLGKPETRVQSAGPGIRREHEQLQARARNLRALHQFTHDTGADPGALSPQGQAKGIDLRLMRAHAMRRDKSDSHAVGFDYASVRNVELLSELHLLLFWIPVTPGCDDLV